jgi:hypothetical protein
MMTSSERIAMTKIVFKSSLGFMAQCAEARVAGPETQKEFET